MLIDTHAHIFSAQFKEDIPQIIENAKKTGVAKIFMPNIDSRSIQSMIGVEEKYKGYCFSMMGLHPCSVKEDFEKELEIVASWLEKRAFSAVGEIGTDLYWDTTFFEQQKEAFNFQVDLAKKHDLPIVIHCRNSIDETIALVEKKQHGNLKGVFHCFTGTIGQAREIINLGFYLGIGGVATFKNSDLPEVIKGIGLQHILLETDSPYLAPAPFRGKRNEPAYLQNICSKIAEIKGVSTDQVADVTSANALKLYKTYE